MSIRNQQQLTPPLSVLILNQLQLTPLSVLIINRQQLILEVSLEMNYLVVTFKKLTLMTMWILARTELFVLHQEPAELILNTRHQIQPPINKVQMYRLTDRLLGRL